MNFNVLPLIRDMGDTLRLRYHEIDHYRYGLPIFIIMMVGIGVANSVMLRPIFGGGDGILMLGVVLGILKFLLLTRATTGVLHYFGSPRIPFLGYALMTEALILPFIFLPMIPEATPIFQLWNMWIFWVQLVGFAKISQQPIWRVLVAYVVYGVLMLFFGVIMMMLFHSAGWIDIHELNRNMETLLKIKS